VLLQIAAAIFYDLFHPNSCSVDSIQIGDHIAKVDTTNKKYIFLAREYQCYLDVINIPVCFEIKCEFTSVKLILSVDDSHRKLMLECFSSAHLHSK
jgi:hypothetical protein